MATSELIAEVKVKKWAYPVLYVVGALNLIGFNVKIPRKCISVRVI